jgi:hypothetical protein
LRIVEATTLQAFYIFSEGRKDENTEPANYPIERKAMLKLWSDHVKTNGVIVYAAGPFEK